MPNIPIKRKKMRKENNVQWANPEETPTAPKKRRLKVIRPSIKNQTTRGKTKAASSTPNVATKTTETKQLTIKTSTPNACKSVAKINAAINSTPPPTNEKYMPYFVINTVEAEQYVAPRQYETAQLVSLPTPAPAPASVEKDQESQLIGPDQLKEAESKNLKILRVNRELTNTIKLCFERNPFYILTPLFQDYDSRIADIEKEDREEREQMHALKRVRQDRKNISMALEDLKPLLQSATNCVKTATSRFVVENLASKPSTSKPPEKKVDLDKVTTSYKLPVIEEPNTFSTADLHVLEFHRTHSAPRVDVPDMSLNLSALNFFKKV